MLVIMIVINTMICITVRFIMRNPLPWLNGAIFTNLHPQHLL